MGEGTILFARKATDTYQYIVLSVLRAEELSMTANVIRSSWVYVRLDFAVMLKKKKH